MVPQACGNASLGLGQGGAGSVG